MDIQKLLPELMEHNRKNGMQRPDIRGMVDRLVETNITQNATSLLIDFTTEIDHARKLQILKNGLLQSGTKNDVLSVDAVSYNYTHNDVLYGDGDQSQIILDLPRLNNFEWLGYCSSMVLGLMRGMFVAIMFCITWQMHVHKIMAK